MDVAANRVAQADSAYQKADYQKALSLYREVTDSVNPSSDLLYNLGNAYYRTGRTGKAVVAWERALRLDPRNSEARENLQFVRTRIADRPGSHGTLLSTFLKQICSYLPANAWAWVAFGAFSLTLAAVALYFFSSNVAARKAGFFGGLVLLIFTAALVFLAFEAASITSDKGEAVVTAPSAVLSTEPVKPRNQSQEAMLLHEGTKVYVVDSVRTASETGSQIWYDVEVDNNHRAWIEGSAVEFI